MDRERRMLGLGLIFLSAAFMVALAMVCLW
jgi:hypothetical protein